MCKILAFTNLGKISLSPNMVSDLKNIVCENDRDGFGYAISDAKGAVYRVRTTETKNLISISRGKPFKLKGTKPIVETSGAALKTTPVSGIFHGRMSTNSVSVENTHPFALVKGGALIHNGVVYDHGNITDLKTDCDTEILARYWDSGGLDDIAQCVSGYAAIAVLDDSKLYIARDDRASLYIAWCQSLETFIVATTIEILNKVAKLLKVDISDVNAIEGNTCLVFQGNSLLETLPFFLFEPKISVVDFSKVSMALGESDDESDERTDYYDDGPLDAYEGFRINRR